MWSKGPIDQWKIAAFARQRPRVQIPLGPPFFLTLLTALTADGESKENAVNEVRSMFSAYNRISNAEGGAQEVEGISKHNIIDRKI